MRHLALYSTIDKKQKEKKKNTLTQAGLSPSGHSFHLLRSFVRPHRASVRPSCHPSYLVISPSAVLHTPHSQHNIFLMCVVMHLCNQHGGGATQPNRSHRIVSCMSCPSSCQALGEIAQPALHATIFRVVLAVTFFSESPW